MKRDDKDELKTPRAKAARLPANVRESVGLPALAPEVEMAKQLITRVSDFTKIDVNDTVPNLIDLGKALLFKGDLTSFSNEMSDLFVKCLSQLSPQIPIVASLLALIHKSDSVFGQHSFDKLALNFIQSISKNQILTAKLNLRAIACLTACQIFPVIGSNSLSSIIFLLLDINKNGGKLSCLGRTAIYLAACTIPWVANTIAKEDGGLSILQQMYTILSEVRTTYRSAYDVEGTHAVLLSNVASTPDGPPDAACWDDFWASVDTATTACEVIIGGGVYSTPRWLLMPWLDERFPFEPLLVSDAPVSEMSDNASIESTTATTGATATSPLLVLSDEKIASLKTALLSLESSSGDRDFAWNGVRFRIFDNESAPAATALLALPSSDRFFISDYYSDILTFFEPQIREDGTRTGSIELLCQHLLAVKKLVVSDDETADGSNNNNNSDLQLEYELVELLLLRVLQIPPNRPAMIGRLLLELCRLHTGMPAALATGIACLFQLLPIVDTSSARQLASLLSYHLLNTDLIWPHWTYFGSEYIEADTGDARRYFLSHLIDALCRASVLDKVKHVVPSALHSNLLDDSPPSCEMYMKRPELASVASEMKSRVERRQHPDELQEWLESATIIELEVEGSDNSSSSNSNWRVGLLIETILLSGAHVKAISPLASLLDRYAELLRSLADDISLQQTLLLACVASLTHDYGSLWIVLDLLLRRAVLPPSVVADWASGTANLEVLSENVWIWALLELPALRAVDGCKAALARHSAHLLAKGDSISEVVVTSSGDGPILTTDRSDTDVQMTSASMEVDEEDRDMTEEALDGGDSRRRRDEVLEGGGEVRMEVLDEDAEEEDTGAVVQAALTESVTTYKLLASRLLVQLQSIHSNRGGSTDGEDMENESILDPNVVIGTSLLRNILRIFHNAEENINNTTAAASAAATVTTTILTTKQQQQQHYTLTGYQEVTTSVDFQALALPAVALVAWKSFDGYPI